MRFAQTDLTFSFYLIQKNTHILKTILNIYLYILNTFILYLR